ncbi:MAG: DUF2807 domain-containing protein, partial [Bacteroidota bacterium]
RAANSFLFASADGVIDTRQMMVPDVIVSSSGTGDCYLLAGSSLNVKIFSLGDVYYMGQPAITSRLEGKGRLIPLN